MYLTYEEYKNYGGKVDEAAFNSYYRRAKYRLDYYTFGRLKDDKEFSENVKECVFMIIEKYAEIDEEYKKLSGQDEPIVSSRSNDGVSESYVVTSMSYATKLNTLNSQIAKDISTIIKQCLLREKNQAGEMLLYRGVY